MTSYEHLMHLSQMVINGVITNKLDHIATIFINSRHYFNVFRRYNSAYNIVIEDHNGDVYLHQDYTARKSLQTIMCLPEYDATNIYTCNATSYKHNGPVPCGTDDIADMRWTEIHTNYQTVSVNFGGIFNDMPPHQVTIDPPSTPVSQIHSTPIDPPGAPLRPQSISDNEAANIILSLSMPPQPQFFVASESDGPTLSMRFADILNRTHHSHIGCYCQMNSDDDEDDTYDSEDENNYTVLRSGTQILKPFTQ